MQQSSQYRRGFTIIEVVLFLAITGLMLAGILASVGAGVNGKRYTEAVDSFQDFLISQFDQTDNVANTANADSTTVQCRLDTSSKPVGTTDCSVVGRLVTSSDGKIVQATPLYAGADVTDPNFSELEKPADLLTALELYTVSGNPDSESYDMRWETSLRSENGSSAQPFTIMIVRLPYAKGSISYISEQAINSDAPGKIGEYIGQVTNDSIAKKQLALCVDPNGLQLASPVGIVVENAGSGGASSIQRKGSLCQ
ncbi:MAG: type II secretion system protein [Psychrobacter sp.]